MSEQSAAQGPSRVCLTMKISSSMIYSKLEPSVMKVVMHIIQQSLGCVEPLCSALLYCYACVLSRQMSKTCQQGLCVCGGGGGGGGVGVTGGLGGCRRKLGGR